MHSWRVLILPFIEEKELYDQYDFSQPWNSPSNQKLAGQMPRLYAFHDDHRPGLVVTNYSAVVGKDTAWPGPRSRSRDEITDGGDATILFVENLGAQIHWMEPRDLEIESMSLTINHSDGLSSKYDRPAVALVDGDLRKIEPSMDPDLLRALLTVNGNERVDQVGDSWRLLHDGRDRPLAGTIDTSADEANH